MEFKLLKAATPTPLMFKSTKPISLFGLQAKTNPIFNSMSMGVVVRKSWKPLQVSAASTEMTPRVDESESLTLESIRSALIRQEDSIIYSLLERSQYSYNPEAYDHSAFAMDNFHGSLVEFMVRETEKLHATVGRYKSPDEHPFFPADLPEPMLPPLQYPQVLHPIADPININKKVWDMYFDGLLPKLVKEGNDGNFGSTAVCDTTCLQDLPPHMYAVLSPNNKKVLSITEWLNTSIGDLAKVALTNELFHERDKLDFRQAMPVTIGVEVLSKRIHYGKYVAEAKFRAAPAVYEAAIRKQDSEKLMSLLTYESVEEAVMRRVEMKAKTYGQELVVENDGDGPVYKINPSLVAHLYGEWIMPLTKEVQVQYLLRRLD